jgi:hypothetical protein
MLDDTEDLQLHSQINNTDQQLFDDQDRGDLGLFDH